MSRSRFLHVALAVMAAAGVLSLTGCLGTNSFFAGRPFPPSTILQRVLVAIQNPSPTSTGTLEIVDARYDIRNSENGTIPLFFISGYKGALPSLILNYPEQQMGYVYGHGDGSTVPVSYSKEAVAGSNINAGLSNSIFVTQNGLYAFAASQSSEFLTVVDRVVGQTVQLNLPNVYKVAVNPSGAVALAFVQNSNYAYRVIHLQQQSNGAIMPPPTFPTASSWPKNVSPVDCQPVNLPIYCVVPVLDQKGMPIAFDRPYDTIFSADGTTGWVLNCGPECGGQQSSVSFLNIGPLDVYNFPGSTYPGPPPANPPPTERVRVPVPGGATMALYGNNTLYVSGQQIQSDGLLEGFLSVINLTSNQVTATYPIADGTHTKMLFGDDNTLWIGSQLCQTGYRTANNLVNGCLTFFNLANNSVLVEPWYGDLTGLCAILEWHKMYTAYGGQLHIYATTNIGITTFGTQPYQAGSELYNGDVTVHGTAFDVAYMDAPSNAGD
ncbi:MAG: hypothetical protein ACYDC6_11805 [Acidobacteriaceae bacterium]